LFVDCYGAEELTTSGVVVVELPEMAAGVRAVNSHLLGAIDQPAKEPEAGL
jgi:diaminohydroxyphosphoribosylaminopyrimidine deaminase/5-amino-6-(5-phosphoribosylamino)uracil reductase